MVLLDSHRNALIELLERIKPDITWVLSGSAGLFLQGVDLPVNDIDIQSNRIGVFEFVDIFPNDVKETPTLKESNHIRSYFGSIELYGVKIELIGDLQHKELDGSWGPVVNLIEHRRWITWEGFQVPVLELLYEADAYTWMGRIEKAKAIRNTIRNKKGDCDG